MRRRSVLLSAVASTLSGALAVRHTAVAQAATPSAMATHPIVGSLDGDDAGGAGHGRLLRRWHQHPGAPATMPGPQGVTFVSTQVGRWEPIDERSVHFTGVQLHTDANGTLVGTVTIDGHPTVSEDGQTLRDDNPESGPTIRDAAGNVVDVPRGGPPVTGVRMGVGSPGLPGGTPVSGTPPA